MIVNDAALSLRVKVLGRTRTRMDISVFAFNSFAGLVATRCALVGSALVARRADRQHVAGAGVVTNP